MILVSSSGYSQDIISNDSKGGSISVSSRIMCESLGSPVFHFSLGVIRQSWDKNMMTVRPIFIDNAHKNPGNTKVRCMLLKQPFPVF